MNASLLIFIMGVVLLLFPPKQIYKEFYETMTTIIIVVGLLCIVGCLIFK